MKLPLHAARERSEILDAGARLAPSTRWALGGLSLSMLLSSLGTSSAHVALPTLAKTFDVSFQAVQWVVLAYLLAITSSIVSVGRLGDLLGRRRLLRAGLLVFSAASVVSGVAPALWLVIVARAAQGLGAAAMMALTVALVGELVPKAKTGSAMGLLGAMSAIGTALGPSLGGVLIELLGWRAIFLINVPLGLAGLLAHRHLPADRATPQAKRAGFDNLGTALLGLTLAAYALAMTLGRGRFGALNLALLAATAIGLVLFLVAERRARAPVIRLQLFRDPALSASLAASLLVSTVLMATLVVGPFYLSIALGLDAGYVGVVMSAGPIVAALVGVPAGRVVDRFGPQRMAKAGLGGIAVGALGLSVMPELLGIPGYVAPIVIVTASYALFQAANNTAAMQGVSSHDRGVVSGTLSLSRNLGLITGACVMGTLFSLASGTSDITTASPDAVASGMRITFAVAAAQMMGALAIMAIVAAARAGARADEHHGHARQPDEVARVGRADVLVEVHAHAQRQHDREERASGRDAGAAARQRDRGDPERDVRVPRDGDPPDREALDADHDLVVGRAPDQRLVDRDDRGEHEREHVEREGDRAVGHLSLDERHARGCCNGGTAQPPAKPCRGWQSGRADVDVAPHGMSPVSCSGPAAVRGTLLE
jgi:MFS family permease